MPVGLPFEKAKPPDPYKTVKISLDKLLLNDADHNCAIVTAGITNAVLRTHQFVTHAYQFIELFILHKYNTGNQLPEIDVKFIKAAFKALSKSSSGPRTKEANYDSLLDFYKDEYMDLIINDDTRNHINNLKKLVSNNNNVKANTIKIDDAIDKTKLDGIHLSSILSYQATDMLTNITNNIQMNFYKYLTKFVRNRLMIDVYKFPFINYMEFTSEYKSAKDQLETFIAKKINMPEEWTHDTIIILEQNVRHYKQKLDELRETKNNIFKDMKTHTYMIINDLLDNTLKSHQKFHDWIQVYRPYIIPQYQHSYEEELSANPQVFLPKMIYMNKQFEALGIAQYQFLPLRKSLIPKYITMDTKAIVELFATKTMESDFKNIDGCKHARWSELIDINHKIFRRKNYSFNYMISTDGITSSILFVHADQLIKDNRMKAAKKAAKEKIRIACKDKTPEEIIKYRQLLKDEKNKEDAAKRRENAKLRLNTKEKNKKEKEEFEESIKNLSAKEKKERRSLRAVELKKKRDASKQPKNEPPYVEFPYVNEDSSEEMIKFLKDANKIYCDPGKRDLLTMMDDSNTYFRYSNKQHVFKTERLKNQKYIQNLRTRLGIIESEKKLSGINSKTCSYTKFKEYIRLKTIVSNEISQKYQNTKFRKYEWYGYLNRQRANSWLVNDVAKTYPTNSVIIMGDWQSGHQMRGFMSTPNIALKRRLAEKFKIFNLDEFRTSCLHHKTEDKCDNLISTCADGKKRKIHAILTYKMKNNRYGCIQRDKNAVNNMKKIVTCYLDNRKRPYRYRRGVLIDDNND